MNAQTQKSPSTRYVQSKQVIQRQVAGETVLVPIAGGRVDLEYLYRLNDVGAAVWEELGKPATLDNIIENVCTQFRTDDHDSTDIPTHIRSFVDELHEAGLVETTKPSDQIGASNR